MNAPWQNGYRLKVDPISGPVRAYRGDRLIVETTSAKVMYETRLPSTIYVPKSDVIGLDRKTEQRTFCPFKGTALYRDLIVGGEHLENAVWFYPRALKEALPIEGMVGFMPGIIDRWEADEGLPPAADDGRLTGSLVDWLMREAWQADGPAELTRGLAHAMMEAGIVISRLNVTLASLHPLLAGTAFIWTRETDAVRFEEARHEQLMEPFFHDSPIRHVMDGLGGVRQSLLVEDAEFRFPIMDDLRREGATDYVAMPLRFSNGWFNAMTLTSDHPEGFTTANLGMVFECSFIIARHYEVHVARGDSETLLSTFLGQRTGKRVLGGEIRRGDGEEIEAAVLFTDLRGSSRMAGAMERADYLDILNRFFETVDDAVAARGGEVLKFIGDAVLAVFPTESTGDGHEKACQRAIECAAAVRDALTALPGPDGKPVRAATGISYGPVTYGNVGSRTRLDFTVIGAAANVAARLSDLGKTLDEAVIVDGTAQTGAGLRPAGVHRLHNIAEPVAVSVLADGPLDHPLDEKIPPQGT